MVGTGVTTRTLSIWVAESHRSIALWSEHHSSNTETLERSPAPGRTRWLGKGDASARGGGLIAPCLNRSGPRRPGAHVGPFMGGRQLRALGAVRRLSKSCRAPAIGCRI